MSCEVVGNMSEVSLSPNETIAVLQEAALQDMCRLKNSPFEIVPPFLIFLLYMCIFLVAVTGNFLVVYVVMTNKKMQTVTNIFITNLAISDLLVNFTSLWLTPMYTYMGQWIWGGWLCHGLPLFQGTSIFISTLTLMAIAMDRYIVIVHHSSSLNINDRVSMRTCILIVTSIWSVSLLLVMPYAVNMRLGYIDNCGFSMCSEDWSDQRLKKVFGIVVMTLQFVVPFVIIGISYSAIWIFLNMRRRVQQRATEIARKKRLLRMLVVMVVLFAVCWFPFNLLNILRDLHMDIWIKPYFTLIFLLVHLISMTATCWNPILYAWLNESFRKEFLRAIPCLRGKDNDRSRVLTDGRPASTRRTCPDRTGSFRTPRSDQQSERKGLLRKMRDSIGDTISPSGKQNDQICVQIVEITQTEDDLVPHVVI